MTTTQPDQTPKVSIVIPSYNTATMIADCLDSVFSQSYRDFEVLVVNDGSPDTEDLERVLKPYLPRIVYLKQPNKRAAGARNTAIGKARGEFLAFLDSDDSWLPEHLTQQMRLFAKDPALDLVYSDCLIVGNKKRAATFMTRCPSSGEATFPALVVERCQIPISSVVARKSAIVRAGLFDESLARCDDYDMWLRTAFHGAKLAYSRKVQAKLNLGRPDSLGQSRSKMAEAYWMILEKALQTLPLNDSQRTVVQNRTQEVHALYLLEEGKRQLSEGHFDKGRELLAQANQHLRRPRIGLAVQGLKIAPGAASRLISLWNRLLSGALA